jgi:hypothetical protein
MKLKLNESKTKLIPYDCDVYEKEQQDSFEKNKNTKQNDPVRDITQKKKCRLKLQKITEKNSLSDTTYSDDKMITVGKQQLDTLMAIFDEEGQYRLKTASKVKIKLSSLSILLSSPDLISKQDITADTIEEMVRNLVEKSKDKKQSTSDRRKYMKTYDDERSKERKKERELDPLHTVKKEFSSLANGIMQEDEVLDIDEEKEKKKQCKSGNAKHYPAGHEKAGEFAPTGQKDGSWSMYFTDGSGCKKGRAKLSGGSEQFTKATNCGRKTKDGDKKNQYKCSKPKEKYSE